MKELGITKGEWKVDDEYLRHKIEINSSTIHLYHTVVTFGGTMITYNAAKANAMLIVDAGNTAQKCGLLPSELLKQRDELKRMINSLSLSIAAHPDYVNGEEEDEWHDLISLADELIKSTEQ